MLFSSNVVYVIDVLFKESRKKIYCFTRNIGISANREVLEILTPSKIQILNP